MAPKVDLTTALCCLTPMRRLPAISLQSMKRKPMNNLPVMIMAIIKPTKHEDGEEGGDRSGKEGAARD